MIRGTDGLDYENITEKLLGNPADTPRNQWLSRARRGSIGHNTVLALPADATDRQCFSCVTSAVTAARFGGKSSLAAEFAEAAQSAEFIGRFLRGKQPHIIAVDEHASLPAPAHPAGPGPEGTC